MVCVEFEDCDVHPYAVEDQQQTTMQALQHLVFYYNTGTGLPKGEHQLGKQAVWNPPKHCLLSLFFLVLKPNATLQCMKSVLKEIDPAENVNDKLCLPAQA